MIKRNRRRFPAPAAIYSLLFLALAPGAAIPARAGDRIIARVGGEAVTAGEVDSALAREDGLSREQAIRLIAERLLVLQWAKKHGVSVSDADVEQALSSVRSRNKLSPEAFASALAQQGMTMASFRAETRDSLVIARATTSALADRISVADEDIAGLWRREYPPRPTFTLRHIFFAVPADSSPDTRAEKTRRAEELLNDIREGKLAFEDAARQSSEDQATRESGGELGIFSAGELFPEMERAVAELEDGKIAGPISGPDGIHLVKLVSRGTVSPPPLETIKNELAERIRGEKGESARRAWLGELEKEFVIEIFPAATPVAGEK